MNHVKFRARALALAASFLFSALPGFGQEARATLSGTITDPSGAAVVGAQVHITNTETAITTSAQSNEAGQYHLLFVNPGTYRLSAEMSGFRTVVREGILLTLGEAATLDILMQVGAQT